MKKTDGVLPGRTEVRFLPKKASYAVPLVTCGASLLAVIVALAAGGGVLFQGDTVMEGLCAGGFLWIMAVSVGAIVRLGILSDKYDLEKYAREAQKAARER